MIIFRLYFGRTIGNPAAGRPTVSDADFDRFIFESAAPRLPGFTLQDGRGFWQGAEERSTLLSFLSLNPSADRFTVRAIARDYCIRFRQDSVLLTEHSAVGDFIGPDSENARVALEGSTDGT